MNFAPYSPILATLRVDGLQQVRSGVFGHLTAFLRP